MSISTAGLACLRFSGVRGFGLKNFHQLYRLFGSVERILLIEEHTLRASGLSVALSKSLAASNQNSHKYEPPEELVAWLDGPDRYLISIDDPAYPDSLKQINLAPPVLYVEGSLAALQREQIAVVGSRKPSMSASSLAQDLGYCFASHGWSVCSGFALGIDAAAHMGALAAKGSTVAVMATGVDRCYPASHDALRERILGNNHDDNAAAGALVTEMPLGTPPLRHNFPRRNRIVSGLSRGVVVVEAGIKSGSLITARYAIEQNRDVFAVPGPAQNPNVSGCHSLIQQGAKLIVCAEDVLEDYQAIVPALSSQPDLIEGEGTLAADEQNILTLLGGDVQSFDALICAVELSHESLSETLLALELKGYLYRVAGGYQGCK